MLQNVVSLYKTSKMDVTVSISRGNFYLAYLEFLAPIHCTTKTERRVLAMILSLISNNSSLSPEKLSALVFSTQVRKVMREKLKMGEPSFNNCISSLRAKGLLVQEKYGLDVMRSLLVDFSDDSIGLKINFNIKKDEKSRNV